MHLDAVSPAWAPVVARDGRPIGMRVTLRTVAADAGRPLPLAALLDGVLAGFVADGGAAFPHGLVVLAALDVPLDESLVKFTAPRNVLVEVGQQALADAELLRLLFDVQRHGVRLALRVDDRATVPRERLPLFQYVVADASTHGPAPGEAAWLATGVVSKAQADAALKEGANAYVGFPVNGVARDVPLQPTQKAVLELIRLVQADADVVVLERAFRGEPMLAYLLLTLANSPAFIRTSPIASLSQAISLLGYKRLTKWLVLLLVIASKDGKALAQIYTAVVRGFCMENLAAAAGATGMVRDECFVVGAFSLLDQITGQSMSALFAEVQMPQAVVDAIVAQRGPYAGYLGLARALESGDAQAVTQQALEIGVPLAGVNSALLQALAATDALQSVV